MRNLARVDARNHYARIKHHTPPPSGATTHQPQSLGATTQSLPAGSVDCSRFPRRGEEAAGLLSQSPTVCLAIPTPAEAAMSSCSSCAPDRHPLQANGHPTNRPGHRTPTRCGRAMSLVVLLRKEVIQPHLPVRLPCYDFVPIASPTFDDSLPCGLGHRLRVLPTFVT